MTTTEIPIEHYNDLTLIHLADRRQPVRLVDGRTARLIRWRGREGHQTARVEFPSGRCATVNVAKIKAVLQ